MSAYLRFFELSQSPFDGKAQTQIVLGTRALWGGLSSIRIGPREPCGAHEAAPVESLLFSVSARYELKPSPVFSSNSGCHRR